MLPPSDGFLVMEHHEMLKRGCHYTYLEERQSTSLSELPVVQSTQLPERDFGSILEEAIAPTPEIKHYFIPSQKWFPS